MSRRDAGPPFAAAALVLGGALAGLALAEGGARLWERMEGWRYHKPFNVGPLDRGLRLYRASFEYGYEPIPFTDGHNALGFRNPDYPPRKRPGTLRVLLAGDSLAEAYGEPLLDELRARFPGREVELWNAAVGGYNLSQYVRRAMRKGLPYEPDLVLLFHCLNDADQGVPVILKLPDRFVGAGWVQQPRHFDLPGAALLWNRSALYRLGALTTLRLRARAGGLPPLPTQEAQMRSELAALLAESRRRGIPAASVLFPLLMPEAEYEKGWQREGRELFPRVLDGAGLPWLDLGPLTPERERRRLRTEPGDYIHMSTQASRPYMAKVARWLDERGLLASRTAAPAS